MTINPGSGLFTDSNSIGVPFKVPDGAIDYCLDRIDIEASQPNPGSLLTVTIDPNPGAVGMPGFGIFSASNVTVSQTPGLISIFAPPRPSCVGLTAGLTFYLTLRLTTTAPTMPSSALWYENSAGVVGTALERPDKSSGLTYIYTQFPVFRIDGSPASAPAILPAYSAFATTSPPNVESDLTVFLEVICPGPAAQFTCPVGVHLPAAATSSLICSQLADAINIFAATKKPSDCWPLPNVGVDPSRFHADCDGDNVRVTNSTLGLCAGAFVCVDHVVGPFNPFERNALSYEYDAVRGPLELDFGGAADGIASDPTFAGGIHLIHRGLFSGRVFTADVPLVPGASKQQIGAALAFALQADNDEVLPTADGIRFVPQEPYDVAVRINDTSLRWVLSPFPDLLARSDVNPGPVFEPSCVAGPTRLCLHHSRFQVEATWQTAPGSSGFGLGFPITGDAGYLSFFDGGNVEVVTKVVDACALDQKFWFFASGLTNVGVDLKVTDTLTGQVRNYHNGLGAPFQPILGTGAFGGCS
jgi:hypothetical protein